MFPQTIEGMKHVCYFRHALALDERRVKFLPEYVYGGKAKLPARTDDTDTSVVSDESPANSEPQRIKDVPPESKGRKKLPRQLAHIKEVWFPGTHSDM